MNDNINPTHYKSENGMECIDAILAQLGVDGTIAYCQGNIAKYLWRWKQKGGVESLRKAEWYLSKMIVLATQPMKVELPQSRGTTHGELMQLQDQSEQSPCG